MGIGGDGGWRRRNGRGVVYRVCDGRFESGRPAKELQSEQDLDRRAQGIGLQTLIKEQKALEMELELLRNLAKYSSEDMESAQRKRVHHDRTPTTALIFDGFA